MSKNTRLRQIYSIFRICFTSYPKGSLAKLYRLGNRIFRPSYSDLDGIPFAESVLFSQTMNPEKYRAMPEHAMVYSHYKTIEELLHIQSKLHQTERMNADVFYKLKQVEPQKTPHSCTHAARYMVLNYARNYYKKEQDPLSRCIGTKLNQYAHQSGYDDGVGWAPLSKILKCFGLFTQSRSSVYGLSSYLGKYWPEDLPELAQCIAYILFCHGPVCVTVRELDEPYSHSITLTGIIQANEHHGAQIIFADPWEGGMMVEPLELFAPKLLSVSRKFNNNQQEYEHVPLLYEASFYRRLVHPCDKSAIGFYLNTLNT